MATNLIIISSKARISPDKPGESLTNLIKVRRLRTYYCLINFTYGLTFQVGVADFMKTGKNFSEHLSLVNKYRIYGSSSFNNW